MIPSTDEPGSEVARLLAQISREYEAAQQGLAGLAQGTSRHRFITRRMERMGALYAQLRSLRGDEAMALIVAQLEHVTPEKSSVGQLNEQTKR